MCECIIIIALSDLLSKKKKKAKKQKTKTNETNKLGQGYISAASVSYLIIEMAQLGNTGRAEFNFTDKPD